MIGHFKYRRKWLSNFLNCKVIYTRANGEVFEYKSVEHGYQAQKATNKHDHDWIAAANGAAEARARGRQVKRRPGFDSFKDRLMLKLLWSKFHHNPYLRKKLIATGGHELIHGNSHHDVYWGVSRRTGEGKNRLGQLLMYLRTMIKEGTDGSIPTLGHKKLQRHRAYRERVVGRFEDANLPKVVRRLPKLAHEEKMAYHPSTRKRASLRKGDKVSAMWSSTVTNVKDFNTKHQAKLRSEAYGTVSKLDPNRPGTSKWGPLSRRKR